jgi:PAS domain S-box-containing protein
MLDRNSASWFYPKPTGDLGCDRNARTIQFACFLFALAIGVAVALDAISGEPVPIPIVSTALGALGGAAVLNRAGRPTWAGRIVILALLLLAVLRVVQARDGFRSHAMLMFPGLLLLSVMLLDRVSYVTTAGIVLLAVAALGAAEKQCLLGTIPRVRTPTSYESIFLVDLTLLAFSAVGSRIARDAETNVADLRASISGLSAANRDLTDTASALRESEQQLASIYNTVRDVIFQLAVEPGGQFRFVSVNAAFLRVTGLSQEAVVGKKVHEVIPEPSLTMVLGRYRQAVEENTIVSWEETTDYPTGRLTGAVSVAPVFDNQGTCTHLVGSVHDITDRKDAEAALRESEERFRTIADTVPVIIVQTDATGNLTFVNKQATEFTGRTLEQLVGYVWLQTIHPDDVERIRALHRASLETPLMGQHELRLRRSDGQYRWMLMTASPRFVHAQFTGYLGTIVDITDLKRTQGELLAAQKLESLGVLAGGIGHDFNNMLGAILAQSELVSADISDDSPAREDIEEIRRIALRGSDTVRQLMAYAGQENPEFRSVDLAALIREMLQLLKLSVSKHARLNVDFPGDLPAVRANAAEIGQVVMNLIMNGPEAIGEQDGVIRVRARRVAIGPQSPGANAVNLPEGEYVRLEISDTGCGIPEEIRLRIFDPFFTTKFTGRGLGLAVVQGIVRRHRGTIHAVSSPGVGTVFEVYLPAVGELVRGDDIAQKPASNWSESAGSSRAVFVIEDEEPLRNAVCTMLRKKNFSVLEAGDGTAGVEIFRVRHADIGVVLLDLTMPGMPGREVLGELKRIRPDVKIVVTTAYSQDAAAASLNSEQAWAFMRKPYKVADLIQLLHKGLG